MEGRLAVRQVRAKAGALLRAFSEVARRRLVGLSSMW
jgi:hypothetical protein